MDDWKPCVRPDVDLRRLPLSAEEGYVLSRLDGLTSVGQLALLTGLPEDRLGQALQSLLRHGVLQPQTPSPLPPDSPEAAGSPDAPEAPELPGARAEPAGQVELRRLYEKTLRPLPPEARVGLAKGSQGQVLLALCLDPLAPVVRAVFQNPHFTLEHARLLAAFHHTSDGLEALLARPALARDAQVVRGLLKNPVLTPGMLTRLCAGWSLIELFRATQTREATSQGKMGLRTVLQHRFSSSIAEQKVKLLFDTEGRALPVLVGVVLDGATVQLLCERQVTSVALVSNLARWAPTPPAVLRHLLNQPLVKRNAGLKRLLSQHPNAPRGI